MKELTERRILKFCTTVLFNQKSIYEFIHYRERIKKYKRYEVWLMTCGLLFIITLITTSFAHNSYYRLITVAFILPLWIIGRMMNKYFKETEFLRKKTYEYFLSQRLRAYLKIELKMSRDGIAKYEEKCTARGYKATLSFAAYIGILLAIFQVWVAVYDFKKEDAPKNIIILLIVTFIACAAWFIFRSVYTGLRNKDANTYKRIAELLSENDYD